MNRKLSLIAFALLASASASSFAGSDEPSRGEMLGDSPAQMQHRIDEGVQSGALTQAEAADLQERLNNLNARRERAKSHGGISPAEHAQLKAEADSISQTIYNKKHNQRGTNAAGIDKHSAKEQQRIDAGVKSGRLTAGEAGMLQERQDRLKADEAAAKADGRLTTKERQKLRKEEQENDATIHRLKHNDRNQ